ncbi:hypothetical protein Tco_0320490 [Tanacetum coccineum]
MVGVCERTVAIPHHVGNFIIPCMVEGIALNYLRAGLPKMILYGEGAGMTVNLIIALRQRPTPPKHTLSLIFPSGFTLSLENPNTVVCISVSLAFIFGWSILKQCSYIISIDAPSSMCILLTRYPSISASITKASSDKSLAGTGGKVFLLVVLAEVGLNGVLWLKSLLGCLSKSPKLELPCFPLGVESHCWAGGEPHKVHNVLEPCGVVFGPICDALLHILPYANGHFLASIVPRPLSSKILL